MAELDEPPELSLPDGQSDVSGSDGDYEPKIGLPKEADGSKEGNFEAAAT